MNTVMVKENGFQIQLDATTRARIADAKNYRQRCQGASAEVTLRLEYENLNRLWGRTVTQAREAMASRSLDLAENFWTEAMRYSTNSQQLAYSCSHLAELYYQQNQFDQAEPLCLRMVTLYRENQESISEADLATALHNTALLYQAMKRFDEAEQLYLEAVQIRTKHLKFDDPLMVSVVDDYKECIRERNRHLNPWARQSQFQMNN